MPPQKYQIGGVVHPHHLPLSFSSPLSLQNPMLSSSKTITHHCFTPLTTQQTNSNIFHQLKHFKWVTQQCTLVWFWWWLACWLQELQLNPVAQMCWWACHRVSTTSQGILQPHLLDAALSLPLWYAHNHSVCVRFLEVVDQHWGSTSTELKLWPCLVLAMCRPHPPVSVTMVSTTTTILLDRVQKQKPR